MINIRNSLLSHVTDAIIILIVRGCSLSVAETTIGGGIGYIAREYMNLSGMMAKKVEHATKKVAINHEDIDKSRSNNEKKNSMQIPLLIVRGRCRLCVMRGDVIGIMNIERAILGHIQRLLHPRTHSQSISCLLFFFSCLEDW